MLLSRIQILHVHVHVYSSLHAKEKPFIGCLSVRKGKEGQGGGPNVSKCCLYLYFSVFIIFTGVRMVREAKPSSHLQFQGIRNPRNKH